MEVRQSRTQVHTSILCAFVDTCLAQISTRVLKMFFFPAYIEHCRCKLCIHADYYFFVVFCDSPLTYFDRQLTLTVQLV